MRLTSSILAAVSLALLLLCGAAEAQARSGSGGADEPGDPGEVPATTPGDQDGESREPGRDGAPVRPMLDVPVPVPQIPPRHGTGAPGQPPVLSTPERSRVAFVMSIGASMDEVLPAATEGDAGGAGKRRTRIDLALGEVRPLIGILGEGVEIAFLGVDRRARAFSPAAGAGRSSAWQDVRGLGMVAGEELPLPGTGATGDPGAPGGDHDRPRGANETPGEQSAGAAVIDLDAAFHELDDALETELAGWLAHLDASGQPMDAEGFAATLRALVQDPRVRQIFVIADSVGEARGWQPAAGAAPELPAPDPRPRATAGQIALVRAELATRPVAERPRIHVLSLAPAGGQDDRALEGLARMSGGVYLRRP